LACGSAFSEDLSSSLAMLSNVPTNATIAAAATDAGAKCKDA